jgi:uncharacterized protein YbjT (DUF2867 family)
LQSSQCRALRLVFTILRFQRYGKALWENISISYSVHFIATGGKFTSVPHFDSKGRVEEYVREIGVPGTFFMPGPFMSNMISNFKKVSHVAADIDPNV